MRNALILIIISCEYPACFGAFSRGGDANWHRKLQFEAPENGRHFTTGTPITLARLPILTHPYRDFLKSRQIRRLALMSAKREKAQARRAFLNHEDLHPTPRVDFAGSASPPTAFRDPRGRTMDAVLFSNGGSFPNRQSAIRIPQLEALIGFVLRSLLK
jgi:hypothetical protein